MRTLVTGANGFIARHLAPAVRRIVGGRIAGMGTRPSRNPLFDAWFTGNLRDENVVSAVIRSFRPNVVYHLVGLFRGSDDELVASNVTTTRNVLEGLRHLVPDTRAVLIGSAAEYGVVPIADQPVSETFNGVPITPYGRAKQEVSALAVSAARDFNQQVMVARPFNVVGPGAPDTLVAGALVSRLRAALAGPGPRSIRVGRTTGIRDFVAVEDVAVGLVRIAAVGRPGHCYNLCSGEGHAIAELLERLVAEVREPISVSHDETLQRAEDVDQMVGSWDKANRELGWRPTISFLASLQATWEASAGDAP